jgi:hypothetical protein
MMFPSGLLFLYQRPHQGTTSRESGCPSWSPRAVGTKREPDQSQPRLGSYVLQLQASKGCPCAREGACALHRNKRDRPCMPTIRPSRTLPGLPGQVLWTLRHSRRSDRFILGQEKQSFDGRWQRDVGLANQRGNESSSISWAGSFLGSLKEHVGKRCRARIFRASRIFR